MRAEVRVLQALRREVRVDLRRREIRMAEHLLQRTQIAAAREQMRRERVAQRVRAHPRLETCAARVPLDDLVETLARQSRAPAVDEQLRLAARAEQRRAPARAVDAERGDRLAPDRHEPFLRALAACAQHSL